MVSDSALISRLALALVVLALFPAAAGAATFTVNTTADGTVCNAVTCSLRGAVTAANTNGTTEDDLITVPVGQFVLSAQFPGGLTIDAGQRVTMRGAGANVTSIEPQTGFAVRVLTVNGAQLALSDLTLRAGAPASGAGGNLQQTGNAAVTLDRVRVAGGQAPQGGGISVAAGGTTSTLTIRQSLINGNTATGTTTSAAGGGLYVFGATNPVVVTVTDSTFFDNRAGNGGAVAVDNNGLAPPVFRGVTFAGNNARAVSPAAGIGGIYTGSAKVVLQGSILTRNTRTVNFGGGPQDFTSNCGISGGATDEGGNLTPADDPCGLVGVTGDPQLDLVPDETLQPPAMKIPATSAAVDIADCAGRTVDQRGVARPQLTRCDAGAFEYQPPPPPPTPTPTPPPTVTPAPTPTPTPTATPVRNTSVGAAPVRGTVLVRLPGTSKFVPLSASVIRNGAEVDVRKGRVEITTSTGEKAVFYDGIFKVSQTRGITTLTLTEKLAPCPSRKARAAAKKPKTRKLWGDGKGKFRTKGKYSAATVRGTRWLVQDGCRYTRTIVAVGSVKVRDDVKKKTFIVRKGKRYIARARR